MRPAISICLFALLLPIPLFASQSVSLTAPSGGASLQSRDVTFAFTFYPGNETAGQPLCAIYVDGVRLAQKRLVESSSSAFEAKNLSRTTHAWYVACEDAQAAVRTFAILTLPEPAVSQNFPASGYSTSANYIDFSFTYNSNSDELDASNCSLAVGVSFRAWAMARSGVRTTIRYNVTPGENSWFVRCGRNVSGKYVSSGQRFFGVQAQPPPKINAAHAANTTNRTENSSVQTTLFNISVVEKNTSKAQPRLVVAQQATLGEEVLLKLLDGNSKPLAGRKITVISPDGNKLELRPTDSSGVTSFYPNATGSYAFIADGIELASPPSLQIAAPKTRAPTGQNPPDSNPQAPIVSLPQIPADVKSDNILMFAGVAAAMLFLLALAAGFFLLSMHKKPPIGEKITLKEVKGKK